MDHRKRIKHDLGMSPAYRETMQVSQWMSMRYSLLLPISEEALQTLESHLATRTFILGTSLTLADLTLFGALHQAVV